MYCQRHGEGHGRRLSYPSSIRSQQALPILLLATPWVPRNAVKQSHVYGRPKCAGRGWQPPTLTPRTHPLLQLSHTQKGKDMEKKSPPHNACRSTAIHVAPQDRAVRTAHPRPQQEGRGAYKSTALSFTSLRPDKLEVRPTAGCGGWRPALTVRHGAHHPLPSECTQHAGARRTANLLTSQWGTKTIVVAEHRCL
ncbi:hypothetical protein TcCL_Unassigned01003 [Trypanosoma cruzi]|nr:hypothetical protein TcCL_Unassigned01003 [Trypanosoma cruzi]